MRAGALLPWPAQRPGQVASGRRPRVSHAMVCHAVLWFSCYVTPNDVMMCGVCVHFCRATMRHPRYGMVWTVREHDACGVIR
eukprot:832691-Pyramimonas_sp.AAC.1